VRAQRQLTAGAGAGAGARTLVADAVAVFAPLLEDEENVTVSGYPLRRGHLAPAAMRRAWKCLTDWFEQSTL
jgi:hypothetical protein